MYRVLAAMFFITAPLISLATTPVVKPAITPQPTFVYQTQNGAVRPAFVVPVYCVTPVVKLTRTPQPTFVYQTQNGAVRPMSATKR